MFEEHSDRPQGKRYFIEADVRNILEHVDTESVDFVVTSPPYWDILPQKRRADFKKIRNYGDSELDLGRIPNPREFLKALGLVFSNVLTVLKPGCYCCVVIMGLKKGKKSFPLDAHLTMKMKKIGFLLDEIIIWDRKREYNKFWPLGYLSIFRTQKVREFIIVCQKPLADGD